MDNYDAAVISDSLKERRASVATTIAAIENDEKYLRSNCPHPDDQRITHDAPCAEADTWVECGLCGKDVTRGN